MAAIASARWALGRARRTLLVRRLPKTRRRTGRPLARAPWIWRTRLAKADERFGAFGRAKSFQSRQRASPKQVFFEPSHSHVGVGVQRIHIIASVKKNREATRRKRRERLCVRERPRYHVRRMSSVFFRNAHTALTPRCGISAVHITACRRRRRRRARAASRRARRSSPPLRRPPPPPPGAPS